ncbi:MULTISPECIES: YgaP family membrane protein [Nocardia]|uniref:YgaP family membrane protein n=1 Tax=Nocardia ignorata TaxID=145285 RepID=UPI0036264FDC
MCCSAPKPTEETAPGRRWCADGRTSLVLLGAVAERDPWWLILTALVGLNLLLYSALGWCPATLALRQLGLADTTCLTPT